MSGCQVVFLTAYTVAYSTYTEVWASTVLGVLVSILEKCHLKLWFQVWSQGHAWTIRDLWWGHKLIMHGERQLAELKGSLKIGYSSTTIGMFHGFTTCPNSVFHQEVWLMCSATLLWQECVCNELESQCLSARTFQLPYHCIISILELLMVYSCCNSCRQIIDCS